VSRVGLGAPNAIEGVDWIDLSQVCRSNGRRRERQRQPYLQPGIHEWHLGELAFGVGTRLIGTHPKLHLAATTALEQVLQSKSYLFAVSSSAIAARSG